MVRGQFIGMHSLRDSSQADIALVGNEVAATASSLHGNKCVALCSLQTPDGRNAGITTVRMIEIDQNPRFATADPAVLIPDVADSIQSA